MKKNHQDKKKQRKQGTGGLKRLIRSLFLMILATVLMSLAGIAVFSAIYVHKLMETLPSTNEILSYRANEASVIYDRNNKVITTLFLENRIPVKLQKVSKWMVMSTLAAEDSSFYTHKGIKPTAIFRALLVDIMHKGARQGGSTITQQLARNLFLSHEKTIERKVKEAILAFQIENLYSKDKILETYLNVIYFGHGAWGISAAAQTYFGKDPAELTLAESSVLAGLIAAPEKYTPIRHLERAKRRQKYVIKRMTDLGWLNEEDAKKALETPLQIIKKAKNEILNHDRAPYFVSNILFKHLLPTYGKDRVYRSGLRIQTTLDLDLQKAAEKALSQLKSEGAIVAISPQTGEILAMAGGKDFSISKFNRAVQAYRQPGSAFKPILYTAALEEGIMPIDHVLDAPISYDHQGADGDGVWAPGNYSNKYHGEITVLEALSHSYNTPAVRLTQLVGVGRVVEMARKLGVTSPYLPRDLSLGLGTASITPIEIADIYAVFANNGYRVKPFSILEIKDSNGTILEHHSPALRQVLQPEIAFTIRSMLLDAVRAGTGRRARIPGYETFGKTGTTNEFSDAWFAGGIPGLVTVVYAGNDDHKPLGRHATGSQIAIPVWKDFMSQAVKIGTFENTFTFPNQDEFVVEVSICRKTGFLAGESCPAAHILLPIDSVPQTICPLHGEGSYLLAQEDSAAPRLLLLPRDEVLYQSYDLGPGKGWNTRAATTASAITIERPVSLPKKELPPASLADTVPPPVVKKAYEVDYSSPETVEKRYQELLQEYGLSGN